MTPAAPLIGAFFGGWEVILVVSVVLILVLACWHLLEVSRERRIDFSPIFLFIAQGFGSGRAPFSPGTFGSLVGLLWVALLIWTGNLVIYLVLAIQGIALSVWLCDEAERILGSTDPGSVVLDEIVALPFCFLPWVFAEGLSRDAMPPLEYFCSGRGLLFTALTFGLFRLFDIWKPWPIRQLQHLPGGWGVTVDDLLAAVYVALCSILWVA